MRAVVQRVTRASVKVEEQIVGAIEHGLLVLLGVGVDVLAPANEADPPDLFGGG